MFESSNIKEAPWPQHFNGKTSKPFGIDNVVYSTNTFGEDPAVQNLNAY